VAARFPRASGRLAAAGLLLAAACSPAGPGDRRTPPAPGPPAVASPAASYDPPAGAGSVGPSLAPAGNGSDLLLTWVEPTGSFAIPIYQMSFSRFSAGSGRWSTPVAVATGKTLFANWADFPGAIAGPNGEILAHWLEKSGDGESYGVHLARSTDGGATWKPIGVLQSDPAAGEHGFVSYAADAANTLGAGAFRAFWLEGSEGGAFSLRSVRVAGGAVGPVELLDDRVCDCCQTRAAGTPAGTVVVYRDRSESEIRDISALRRTASGWGKPVAVHADGWEIPGCPVNGPALAALGKRLAVAWFTAAAPGPRVLAAFSEDGGATFGSPVVVDGARPVGRVDVAFDPGRPAGSAVVSWVAPASSAGGAAGGGGEKAAIWLRRVGADGKAGAPLEVPGTTTVRASGFPRMGLAGDSLLLAWGDDGTPSHLRASRVPLATLP
jgi:hypothetical protein